jgi:poly-gamma-glutamate capsule biosynthesis protein CapA/YwtB (metallophosphatase superfamily)
MKLLTVSAFCCALVVVSAQSADRMTITLTGQSMIRSDLRATAPAAVTRIRGMLKGDIVFTNLEASIAQPGETIAEGRGFLAPAEALDALTACGFNLLALAGNHAFDLRVPGIQNTIREANTRKIAHAGTGNNLSEASEPAYVRTPKGTVALVASASGLIAAGGSATVDRPGVNELRVRAGDVVNEATEDLPGAPANRPDADDARRILQSIRDARQRADVVIVYQHNHVFGNRSFSTLFTEGMPERLAPNEWLRDWVHQEIDAGADIVVMHGAPLLHGVEMYRGRLILYDLGNFIYNLPATLTYIDEPMSWESAIASVEIQGRTVKSVSFRPVVLNPIGDGQPDVHNPYADNEFLHTRGLPSLATGTRARYILERLAGASKPFGTALSVNGEVGTLVLNDGK